MLRHALLKSIELKKIFYNENCKSRRLCSSNFHSPPPRSSDRKWKLWIGKINADQGFRIAKLRNLLTVPCCTFCFYCLWEDGKQGKGGQKRAVVGEGGEGNIFWAAKRTRLGTNSDWVRLYSSLVLCVWGEENGGWNSSARPRGWRVSSGQSV